MEKPEHHIFVCMSFRGLEPKGKCIKKNAPELLGYLESELADRGLDNVMVSTTGCLKLCDNGPIVVVYPEGYWYQEVEGEEAIDAILDAWKRRPGQGLSGGLRRSGDEGRGRRLQTPSPSFLMEGRPVGSPEDRS